jgi:DNA modification methylase
MTPQSPAPERRQRPQVQDFALQGAAGPQDRASPHHGRMAKGGKDERHICPLQLDVIERCLTLYSNPRDVVMDPFNGIGSTGFQAVKMGRKYIGIELKPEYAKQAAKFLPQAESQSTSLFSASGL